MHGYLFKSFLAALPIRHHAGKQLVILGAVVMNEEMAELMHDNVINTM